MQVIADDLRIGAAQLDALTALYIGFGTLRIMDGGALNFSKARFQG